MKSTTVKSNRFLFGLFIVALPIFILMRWDYSTWLTNQVTKATSGTGINISYDQVSLSGLGVTFKNINVGKENMQNVFFEELGVSLSFSSLFSGNLGAEIDALWKNNPISFSATQDGELIKLNHIDAQLELGNLAEYQRNIIAKVSGQVSTLGSISFNQNTQQLQTANLSISWNNAKAGLSKPEFDLGDLNLQMNSSDELNQPWSWNISGTTAITLSGSGTFTPQNPNPRFWAINGEADIQIDDNNPSLAMMLQAFAGSNHAKVRLSGTLSNPRTDIIR